MQIILLGGKSVINIQNHKIDKNDTIYAINQKAGIEKILIEKHNRKIDVWMTVDIDHYYDEVCDFLNRKEDNRLITHISVIERISYLLESRPLPNPHKIIIINNLSKYVVATAITPHLNSLSELLTLLSLNKIKNVALFGCDGVANIETQDIYFDQINLRQNKLRDNRIYLDMKWFEEYYPILVENVPNFKEMKIINTNLSSFYQCFDKNTYLAFELKIQKFIPQTPSYSIADLMILANIWRQDKVFDRILARVTRPPFFKRVRNRFGKRLSKFLSFKKKD